MKIDIQKKKTDLRFSMDPTICLIQFVNPALN